jgi:PEGA domain
VIPNGYYGGFYPWGYAGLGFGGYYAGYYGYYDPWGDDGYYGPVYAPVGSGDAELRLKVKPRDAKVYVDGFYAGIVDDFDGVFQRLRLDAGPHHIEIRADGYEPLEFDVDARRNRTTTYRGELVKD